MHSKPTDPRFIDVTGLKFGRLFAKEYVGKDQRRAHLWLCQCDCGSAKTVRSALLRNGNTSSCGCLALEARENINVTHGMTRRGQRAPEYAAYSRAKERCQSPTSRVRQHYGGRGIEFRYRSFVEFLADVGERPSDEHSLDRIDVNGHYEPGNVRWATRIEQARNRRDNVRVVVDGESMTLRDACDKAGMSWTVAIQRHRAGWCDHCTLSVAAGARSGCSHKTPTRGEK